MSDEATPSLTPDVDGRLPPAIRQQLRQNIARRQSEQRKVRRQRAQNEGLVARAKANPQASSSQPIGEEVTRAILFARRNYLALLSEPEVIGHFREVLTTGKPNDLRAVLDGLRGILIPESDSGRGGGGQTRVTFVNKIGRPAGSPALDVTPEG